MNKMRPVRCILCNVTFLRPEDYMYQHRCVISAKSTAERPTK